MDEYLYIRALVFTESDPEFRKALAESYGIDLEEEYS